MNDIERRRLACDAADVAAEVAAEMHKRDGHGMTALDRMRQATGAMSAQRFQATSRSSSLSDPTADAALRGSDMAAGHLAEVDHALRRLHATTRRLREVMSWYDTPRVGRATDRLQGDEPGCESCARVPSPAGGAPRWEPPYSKCPGPTTVGGRLERAFVLCRWCYGRAADTGRLPTPEELQRHHSGERVPWPSDVPRPA